MLVKRIWVGKPGVKGKLYKVRDTSSYSYNETIKRMRASPKFKGFLIKLVKMKATRATKERETKYNDNPLSTEELDQLLGKASGLRDYGDIVGRGNRPKWCLKINS